MKQNDDVIAHWNREVSRAAATFERRWTWGALQRVDTGLAGLLREQRQLFDEALVTGTVADIALHGPATCRGWAAAVRAMGDAAEPDSAYFVGVCPKTGFKIAVGQRAAADRVAELHGTSAAWFGADEVAEILAGLEQVKTIAAIKRAFPGAEIVDRYPDEPAKADAA